jgi:hypothetical protein
MRRDYGLILILNLLCLAVYFNSLNNGFVYDDEFLVADNKLITSSKFLPQIFTSSLYEHSGFDEPASFDKMYRPLQLVTYGIDYKIWKLAPFGFRLTNILLHLLNAFFVYYLLWLISHNITASFLVSVLFLVHPAQASVVSYIAGRADLLAGLFILLGAVTFFRFIELKRRGYYFLSLLCACLALLSRENALTLCIFLALILLFLKAQRRQYLYIIPFLLLNLGYLFLRFAVFGSNGLTLHDSLISAPFRLLNFLYISGRYILVLVFPVDLHIFRSVPFISSAWDVRIVSIAVFLLIGGILLYKLRKNRLAWFGVGWFFTGIIPVFFFMDGYRALNQAVMAESWLYLSCAGFFVIIVLIADRLRKAGRALLIIFIIFLCVFTAIYNTYWKDDITLFRNALKYASAENPVRKNLINAYFRHGRYKDALDEIKKLAGYYPNEAQIYILWGNRFFAARQFNAAIDTYNISLSKRKDFYVVYYNLSACYAGLKQVDKAIGWGLECFRLLPLYLPNLIQLGDLYVQVKDFKEASIYYRMALELDPHSQLLKERMEECKKNI